MLVDVVISESAGLRARGQRLIDPLTEDLLGLGVRECVNARFTRHRDALLAELIGHEAMGEVAREDSNGTDGNEYDRENS